MFKEGDRVRVRHHTEYEKENYEFRWTSSMDRLEGTICIICEVRSCGYIVRDELGLQWAFTPQSLSIVYEQF